MIDQSVSGIVQSPFPDETKSLAGGTAENNIDIRVGYP
jgi:hypothetical protein